MTRTKIVDAAGGGDFETIEGACYAVSLEARDSSNQWQILVWPGVYKTSGFAVPTWTSVQGTALRHPTGGSVEGQVRVDLTGGSGDLITLAQGSTLCFLDITYSASNASPPLVPAGAVTVVAKTGGGSSAMWNCQVMSVNIPDTYPLDLIACKVGGLTLYDVSTNRAGVATQTRSIVCADTAGFGMVVWGGRHNSGTAQGKVIENVSPFALSLYGLRIIPRLGTTDIAGTSGTVSVVGTPYSVATGTVSDEALHAARVTYSGGATDLVGYGDPIGVVVARIGSTYRRLDGAPGATLYVKESDQDLSTGWSPK